jgi:thiamine biosynthesis protein ThiS
MKIIVNGKEMNISERFNIIQLLAQLGIQPGRVVVERNESEIISRSKFEEVFLCDGDKLEILNFVGGGS